MHYPFPSAASIQNFVVLQYFVVTKYYKTKALQDLPHTISRASVYLDMVWGKLELLGITWQALQGAS